MRPVSLRPMLVQVAPGSVGLYPPSPVAAASRIAQPSPVPAHTGFGSDGAVASDPIACTPCLSNTGRNVLPLSVDFHTPPDAAPRYQVRESPTTPAIAAKRPPLAGPRNWKRIGAGPVPPPRPPRWASASRTRAVSRRSEGRTRFIGGGG